MVSAPARPRIVELTAISVSVILPAAAEFEEELAFVEFGTRTSDTALYDGGRERITPIGMSAPTSTQAVTIQRCCRTSCSASRTSNTCSDKRQSFLGRGGRTPSRKSAPRPHLIHRATWAPPGLLSEETVVTRTLTPGTRSPRSESRSVGEGSGR